MTVSTEDDNNFGYENITIVVDNIPLSFHPPTMITSFIRKSYNLVLSVKNRIMPILR
jgi:hypothetical protein